MEYISIWTLIVPLVVALASAIGSFIVSISSARKTAAEAKAIRNQNVELYKGQKEVLSQFQNGSDQPTLMH